MASASVAEKNQQTLLKKLDDMLVENEKRDAKTREEFYCLRDDGAKRDARIEKIEKELARQREEGIKRDANAAKEMDRMREDNIVLWGELKEVKLNLDVTMAALLGVSYFPTLVLY